ncbi:hypothetical protein [Flavobacterium sp.]|uniref:hypothetical protein n=1 Tax=Flavobacterium sp. TaxID=239 RepID=UPI0025F34BF4|nr:hypothetical protein [Flavobacterium sp.]
MINSLSEDEFRSEIFKIQFETSDWVISNFDLNDDQIEYTRLISKDFMTYIGFQTATAIATKQEIVLETPEVYQNPVAGKRKIKTKIEGSDTWNWAEEPPRVKFKWSVSLIWSF